MMNKLIIIVGILVFAIFPCKGQTDVHKEISFSFLEQISSKNDKASFENLYDKEMLHTSQNYSQLKDKTEANVIYDMIIDAISEEIQKYNEPLENFEILTLKESKRHKKYSEHLNLPDNYEYHAYILYHNTNVITRFLIKENKIASFSVINKSGERFFVLF